MGSKNCSDDDATRTTNVEKADSEPIHSEPKCSSNLQGQTSQTLRTSNRYKNLWKTRRSISDVFSEDEVKKGKEDSNLSTEKPDITLTMSSPTTDAMIRITPVTSNSTASSLSLYSPSEKLVGVEMPRLSAAHDVLDTGLDTKTGNSALSRLFYKILSSSSTSSSKSREKKSATLHKLVSPYVGNELNDQICECYERVENLDRKKPSYMTGSLIIHCKALKKLFNENMKSRIIKRQADHQMCLENWKLAISSMEIFIEGLEKQMDMRLLESPGFNENDKPGKDSCRKYNEDMDKTTRTLDGVKKLPEKYKMPLRKNLYSYDKNDSESKKDDLDTFLDDLNNRLKEVNKIHIL